MATTTNKTTTGDTDAKGGATTPAKAGADYASQIGGAINKASAEKTFGEGKARAVFNAVAEAGGHGSFNDGDYNGGVTLAVPASNKELRAKINEALKDLE